MSSSSNLYRILIRDLMLMARIGIHPHERQAPQRVLINIEMTVSRAAEFQDDIASVISYEDVISGIKALIDRGHVNLVETLAAAIIDLCLSDSRVLRVVVRVEKPDVYAEAHSVGVELEQSRI